MRQRTEEKSPGAEDISSSISLGQQRSVTQSAVLRHRAFSMYRETEIRGEQNNVALEETSLINTSL